ncbi:energy transducer TonB [Luteimonas aestuarii]|uniref:Energy transducer TonB n=1 Tax=Luteimonas aestuarii TaxID=453837 RepID=A0A4R5TY12_9GAMM|nr:energy transducer TonB [Luteimonas aestuarii]TDK26109.1 energy transducer TonB [Luteimonas aestuarii]
MVLQHAHRHSRTAAQPSLDSNRILGMSGTLAVNVLAFLLLFMPMAGPPPLAVVEQPPRLTVVDVVPLPPVTPKPPERVEVVPPQPRPQPIQRTQQPTLAPATDPVVVDDGTVWTPPLVETTPGNAGPVDIAPPGPVQGMRLEYARTSPPRYPREALRDGLQGTVLLQVLVDVDGKPLEVSVHTGSGHRVLDQEAVRHVLRHWTFRPATKDGRAVQAIGLVPIEFKLDRM